LILNLLLIFLFTKVSAQDSTIHRNSTYLELGGNGLWYSFNYDRIIKTKEKCYFSSRLGFSYLGNSDSSGMTLPLTASYLFGKNKSFFELGGGPTLFHAFKEKITAVALFGIVGYRHQKLNKKGFMYRFTFNPFIGEISSDKGYWNWVFLPFGGISLGYNW